MIMMLLLMFFVRCKLNHWGFFQLYLVMIRGELDHSEHREKVKLIADAYV